MGNVFYYFYKKCPLQRQGVKKAAPLIMKM